jgi:predicted nucleic acid-binding protein
VNSAGVPHVTHGTVFVDTSAWFNSIITAEANHLAAAKWLSRNKQPLLTTDFVLDETLTLLRARHEEMSALRLGTQLFGGEIAQLYHLTEDDVLAAWEVFRLYSDKEWSFTDCTSKVVIEKLGLTHAFAFDQHFRQFGSVAVVP